MLRRYIIKKNANKFVLAEELNNIISFYAPQVGLNENAKIRLQYWEQVMD